MDLNASAPYEFLDLTDIDEYEKKKLICTLYKSTKEDTNSLNATTSSKSKKSPHGTSSNTNTNKDYTSSNSKHSRYESGKHAKNIAAINLTQQLTPTNEKATSTHLVRNLMIPRFITPIALPYCAVVKPTLAEVAVVPLRTPALTAGAAANAYVEPGQPKTKAGRKASNQAVFTMAAHSSVSHHQQQQQQQQQHSQQQQHQQQSQSQSSQQHIINSQTQPQSSSSQAPSASHNTNHQNMHPSQTVAYNQIPPGMFVPSHGAAPVGGAMYQMLPAALSPNVYVNNVTANVNLHGYVTQPMQQYIPSNATPAYVSADVQQANPQLVNEQSNQIVQQTSSVAISRTTTRRGGRGRGNNSGQRRNEFSQRQQANTTSQDVVGSQVDPQTLAAGSTYSPYFQYAYQPQYFGTPTNITHQQAQHAAGAPVYFTGPVYTGHPLYPLNYQSGVIYQAILPQEYPLLDEKGEEQQPQDGLMQQMWHSQMQFEYPEGYMHHEMVEDVNHNPSPLNSAHTPSMLSPVLQPMYDGHVPSAMDIQQHMNELHIYDTSPLAQHTLQPEDQVQECQQLNEMVIHDQMDPQALVEQPVMVEQGLVEENRQDYLNNNEGHIPIMEDHASPIMENECPPQIVHHTGITSPTMHATAFQPLVLNDVNPPMQTLVSIEHEQMQQHVEYEQQQHEMQQHEMQQHEMQQHEMQQHEMQQHEMQQHEMQQQQFELHLEQQRQQFQQEENLEQHPPEQIQQQPQQIHPKQGKQQKQEKQQQQPQHRQHQKRNQQQKELPPNQEQHHELEKHQQEPHLEQTPQENLQSVEPELTNNKEHQQSVEELARNEENVQKTSQKQASAWNNNHAKKTTASVAVTALPGSANKQNLTHSATNVTNGTKPIATPAVNGCATTVATQVVQVKSHGVMKLPSSPPNDTHSVEKKSVQLSFQQSATSTVSESAKTITTTSIASTVVPHQLQESKTHQASADTKKADQLNTDSEMTSSKTSLNDTQKLKEETPVTVVVPTPAPVIAPPQSKPTSWASLFQDKSSSANQSSMIGSIGTSNVTRKPVAKVLPFEGTSNFVPQAPGILSYSAASAQGLPQAQLNNTNNSKPKLTTTVAPMVAHTLKDNVDEWSLKFADFLTKYKTDFTPVSLRPRGLTNRSNYCYINSTLQALVGCPPFYNLMKAIPKQPPGLLVDKPNTPTINAMIDLINEFSHLPPGARLLTRREKGHNKKDDMASELQCDPAFEPTAIYKLWNANRSEDEGRQEDAEEFLGFVLNKLNDEMLEVMKLIAKPSSDHNGESNVDGDDGGDWQVCDSRNKGSVTRQTDFGRTPLSDIFHGEVRSKLQRGNEYSTYVIQPFFTLPLNIEKVSSVKEALELLVGRDQLEGVTCSKTNQEINAWQQMNLEKLPVVLILHLKWFDYKMDGCTKILKTVEFPVELKIDTKILASKKYSQKQRLYRLFAVVYHDGKEATKGHYITDVHHAGYLSWLRFDDSSVKPVSEYNVLRPRVPRVPYLLYYRRCDTVPTPTQNVNNNSNNTNNNNNNNNNK